MPWKPSRYCKVTFCPNLTTDKSGYCEQHKKQYSREYDKQRSKTTARRLYNTAAWRLLQKKILSKSPLCAECRRNGRLVYATVVHHIKDHNGDPVLFWDENNLEALCAVCHNRKTAKTQGFGRKPKTQRLT